MPSPTTTRLPSSTRWWRLVAHKKNIGPRPPARARLMILVKRKYENVKPLQKKQRQKDRIDDQAIIAAADAAWSGHWKDSEKPGTDEPQNGVRA